MLSGLVMIAIVVLVVGLVARRRQAMRADGSGWATTNATAMVDGDAGELCRRALREVTGTETDERFARRVTFVATPGANVGFTLTPADDGRTEVEITVAGTFTHSELSVRHGRERAALATALARWLTEHGNESRVRHT
jgi:hypothetical protein